MKRLALSAAFVIGCASPAFADYGCWPFGGVDALVFPSCTASGGHRSMDVNVIAMPAGNTNVNVAQFGGSNVVTGLGTSGAGIPRITVSNDSTLGLVAGTAIIGKVGIDQTTPGTTNGVQVNAALPAGGNTIGAVTQASAPWAENITQFGGSAFALGTAAIGASLSVTPATAATFPVSGTITANQGGTWTVQPGNTANTTPWLATISQGGNSATVTAGNALKIDGSAATQPVSGTVTANAGTGNFTVVQATGSNLHAVIDAGTAVIGHIISDSGSVVNATLQAGSAIVGKFTTDQTTPGTTDLVHAKVCDATTPTQCQTTDASGNSHINICGSASTSCVGVTTADADARTNTVVASFVGARNSIFNGTTWDRQRTSAAVDAGQGTGVAAVGICDTTSSKCSNITASNALKVDGSAVTQPVSGTVTANAGTGTMNITDANNPCKSGTLLRNNVNDAGSGNTVIVTHSASTSIYVCGYVVNNLVATGIFQFHKGTGASCGTSEGSVSERNTGLAGGTYTVGFSGSQVLATITSGVDLCVNGAGTGPDIDVGVLYVQQ